MASRESEALKTLYRGWAAALAANPEMPLDELRLMFEHWGDATAEPGGVDYIETNAGGVPALWAVPKECVEDRVLLCMHGGGYVTASMYTHRKVYGHLAKAIGCRALILHYRRARSTYIRRRSMMPSPPTGGCSTRASHLGISP